MPQTLQARRLPGRCPHIWQRGREGISVVGGAASAEEDAVIVEVEKSERESGDDGHDGVVDATVIEEYSDLVVESSGAVAEVVEPGGVLPRGVDDATEKTRLLGGASRSTSTADELSGEKGTPPE